jgi:FkbM family methyltransferase
MRFLHHLDALARVLRQIGLQRVTRTGRELIRRALRNGITITWHGVLLTGSIEHRGYLASMMEGSREAFMAKLFEERVRSGSTVVDVGSHLGTYALVAGRKVGSTGRVYAFEPDPRNVVRLRENVAQNKLGSTIEVIAAAASDQTGNSILFLDDADPSVSSLAIKRSRSQAVRVPTFALDDFLSTVSSMDVVKIDVEGMDLRALRGMTRLLERSDDVVLFCECNPSALKEAGATSKGLLEELEALGFDVRVISELERVLKEPALLDWASVKAVNLLCTRMRRQE